MTMPQTRHYEMKDSGVEWRGEIPRHWEQSDIGALYTLRNTKVSDKDYPPLSVTMRGILPQLETVAKTNDGDNRKLVMAGDFAINSRSDRRGSCGISSYDGSVSLINTVLTPRGAMHPGFYDWLFHTEQFADEFYKWGHGIVDDLWTTCWSEMKSIIVPTPPLSEQTAIAAYLDEKCATIDAIIAEAKASIEGYKSWKASVIFETVTKGLNPYAEMKDSGVEWIGEIPKGWKIVPAKFFMKVQAGYPFDSERFDNSQGIPLIRIRDITSGHTETFYNGDYPEEYVVHNNDLLVGMDGDFNVRWWQGGEAVLNQRCCRIFAQKGLILRYFYFLLPFYLKQVNELAYSTTVKHLANGDIGNADICLPPEDEQTAIAAYLDSKCAAIDGVILEKEDLIRELENYRRSLIFEVVTGKRRVC